MFRITIRHNFETAHRLSHPDAPIKCQSIHGHSWWATVEIEGESTDEQGMLVEFGAFKKAWRSFLDDHVDHHLLAHERDVVAQAILEVQPEARLLRLPFDPTTELLARWLFEQAERVLAPLSSTARVSALHIQETAVNGAEYRPIPS